MASLRLELPASAAGRVGAVDELKGVAILLVIFYHAGGVLGLSPAPHGELGVDMFVILSGIGLALGRPAGGGLRFLLRRFWRIYPAYWIALTVFLLGGTFILGWHFSAGDVLLHYLGIHGWFGDRYALSINESFWFVTLIVSLYLLYAALGRLAERPDRLLFYGSLVALALAVYNFRTNQLIGFDHISLRIPGFFLGLLFGRLIRDGRLEIPATATLAGALLVLLYAPYTQGFVFASVWPGAALMVAYVCLLRPHLSAGTRGALGYLGDRSLEIFLIHQPLIREYNMWVQRRLFPGAPPTPLALSVGIVAGLAVTLAASAGLHSLLARLPAPGGALPVAIGEPGRPGPTGSA
jgi:peptidoglycan/LPS O-acetylase OafA/YrhL